MTKAPFGLLVACMSLARSTYCDDISREAIAFTVGVIANETGPERRVSVSKFGYNISSVSSPINTTEPFSVFIAVQRFNSRNDIDVILLFDVDVHLHLDAMVLSKGHKQTITFDNLKLNFRVEEQHMNTSDEIGCQEKSRTGLHGVTEPYCEIDVFGRSVSIISNAMASSVVTDGLAQLLIDSLHWTEVYILHENATDEETSDLVDALSLSGVMSAIYNIDTTPDFNDTLAQIYHGTARMKPQTNFVVLCRSRCVRKVLQTANSFDSHKTIYTTPLKQFSHWLIAVFGHSNDVPHIQCIRVLGLNNVAVLAVPDVIAPSSTDVTRIVDAFLADLNSIDVADPTIAEHITKADIIDLFLKKAKTWHPSTHCKGFKIDTLLWTSNGRAFSTVGSVDAQGHLHLQSELFPNIKYGYNKQQFIVATLPYDPFVIKHTAVVIDKQTGEPTDNTTVHYEGLTMDLLQELSRILNFTYVLIEPADQQWGIEVAENYTFNGLIGQVQRLECDFVAAPISIQPNRDMVIDFSYPFFYEYTTVMVKKTDQQTLKWRTLIDPLRVEVLIALCVGLVLVTLLIYVLEKYNPFYDIPAHREEWRNHGGLHYLHNSFWYMYGCMLYQGGVHLPGSIAGRTFISCWWLMCLVVIGIYSGNLIAFLTVTKEKPPFNTLEEMVDNKDYKYGTLGGSAWDDILMTSSIPIFKKIGDGMRQFMTTDPGVLSISLEYHLDRVGDGGYAWIGDSTTMEILMATECDIIKLKQQFMPLQYAFGFPENSLHTSIFSEQIMAMHESGLFKIWKRKWWPKSNVCALNKVAAKATAISLVDVQSAFYVCVLGVCVGLVAFVVEHIVNRVRRTCTGCRS